jgi:hypothetical protein
MTIQSIKRAAVIGSAFAFWSGPIQAAPQKKYSQYLGI